MSKHKQNPLLELAELCGLELTYQDTEGQRQFASDEAILGALRGLGIALDAPSDAPAAIAEHHRTVWHQVLEPFSVLWDGVGALIVRCSETMDPRTYHWELVAEDGTSFQGSGICQELPKLTSAKVGDKRYIARTIEFHEPVPQGYATFALQVGGRRHRSAVVVAPTRAYQPDDSHDQERRWGVFVPLYALRREERPGIGDLGDLQEITEWVHEQGGSVVGTLPLLASFLDEPFAPSPYAPVSRLYWNELFLDLDAIPEYAAVADSLSLPSPSSSEAWIDYSGEMAIKRQALEAMLAHLENQTSDRAKAFDTFARENKEAARYAAFRAVNEKRKQPWSMWPKSMQGISLRKSAYDTKIQRYHLYVQWNLQQQLERLSQRSRQRGLGLYLDLALGVHPLGYDTWRYKDVFASDVATGAPPDELFRGGQNWGFPPLHPGRLQETGYEYVIQSLRNHMRYAGVLRIDHVMGLHRLYWIPDGMGAKEGVYVKYRPDHFYAILSLESHRNKTLLIGEDLGTVEPVVRQRLLHHGIERMFVMPFAAHADDTTLALPPTHAVASLNTHDMPMFASLWTGKDMEDRVRLGFLTAEQADAERSERAQQCQRTVRLLHKHGWLSELPDETFPASPATAQAVLEASLKLLAASESRLLLVTLEDLWQETRSQNIPGTGDEQNPNWRGRTQPSLEQILRSRSWSALLQDLQRLRQSPVPKALQQPITIERVGLSAATPAGASASTWGELDDYYFAEGTHDRLSEKMGARPEKVDGEVGVRFRVWAPRARSVSVVGDFNQWRDDAHPLQSIGVAGIWEGFVPGLEPGTLYKYNIEPAWGGESKHKFDPMGFLHEKPPHTASVVWELSYEWGDQEWMEHRKERNSLHAPLSIYEVHLGSWMRDPNQPKRLLSFRELAPRLADYAAEMGFTHVELMPVMEHPFHGSWGYQSTGYYAPSRRYGTPQDLMALIDALHQRDVGVILDWVPSHFPRDDYALVNYDGTATYEYEDSRKGYHPDWTSHIFDYGRGPVQSFLLSSAMFWLKYYHVDGLRVDGVASMLYLDYSREPGEWLPNVYGGRENLEAMEFLKRMNETVYRRFPDVQTFAEESTSWPGVSRPTSQGGLGFGLKWDMGWMHDTLKYLQRDPIHRRYHHHDLTFRMLYAFHENFVLALSHDEVVHGKGSLLDKMPGDHWRSLAQLRLLYGYMFGMPGKKLLFMGQEFGMGREWDHDTSIDWHLLEYDPHRGLQRWLRDLNQLYRTHTALHHSDCSSDGFEWVTSDDADNSVYVWLRRTSTDAPPMLVCCNFTPVPRYGYRVGVPVAGHWEELANSDASLYGGSGEGNLGGVESQAIPTHNCPHSVELTLPPFGVLFFCPAPTPA